MMRSIGKKAADRLRAESGARIAAGVLFFGVCAVVATVVQSVAIGC